MYDHYSNDAKLARLMEAAEQATYAYDAAIRENGVRSPLNRPAMERAHAADEAVDKRRAQLDAEAGIDDSRYTDEVLDAIRDDELADMYAAS